MADLIDPQLAPDETELRRAAGRARFPRARGADVVRGEIVLTDQRLVFAPLRAAQRTVGLDLVLGQIVEIRPWRASAWPWARLGIELTTRLGPKAPVQLILPDRDARCDAIGSARADFRGRTDLSGWLAQAGSTGGPSPAVLRALERTLVDERVFPGASWRPDDARALSYTLREAAEDLGLPDGIISDELIAGLVDGHSAGVDEEAVRLGQLDAAVQVMNEALSGNGDPRRLHPFAADLPGLDTNDSVFWALCTEVEAEKLLGLGVVRERER